MSFSLEDLKFIFNEYIRKEKKLKILILSSIIFSITMLLLIGEIIPSTKISTLNNNIKLKKTILTTSSEVGLLKLQIIKKEHELDSMKGTVDKTILFDNKYPILEYTKKLRNDLSDKLKIVTEISSLKPEALAVPTFRKEIRIAIKKKNGSTLYASDILLVINKINNMKKKVKVVGISISAANRRIASATIKLSATQIEDTQ